MYALREKIYELLCSLTTDSVLCVLDVEFSLVELHKCLKKNDSALGLGNITYSLIINLRKIAKMYLLRLHNAIFTCAVSKQWRDIQVIPNLKSKYSEPAFEIKACSTNVLRL